MYLLHLACEFIHVVASGLVIWSIYDDKIKKRVPTIQSAKSD